MGWKPNNSSKVWEKFEFEDIKNCDGFDTYLWMNYLDPIRIPDHFYYSASYSDYQELDYPIVLFNKGYSDGLEKEEIYSTVHFVGDDEICTIFEGIKNTVEELNQITEKDI